MTGGRFRGGPARGSGDRRALPAAARPSVALALGLYVAAASPASWAAPGGAAPAAGAPSGATQVALAIDAGRSALTFTIHRPGETIEGVAHRFTGEVLVDPEDLSRAPSVVLRVEAASLETGNRMRDRKMRTSHLETDRFPTIEFRSTSVQVGADRPAGEKRKALVEGALALHGAERSLIVPAAIRYDNGVLEAEGSVHLTYSDYGIPIPRFLWLVMDDDIQVRFRLVAAPAPR